MGFIFIICTRKNPRRTVELNPGYLVLQSILFAQCYVARGNNQMIDTISSRWTIRPFRRLITNNYMAVEINFSDKPNIKSHKINHKFTHQFDT